MASSSRHIVGFLCVILCCACVACVKVRPLGIVPTVSDEKLSQWQVLYSGPCEADETDWTISAVFIPGRDEHVLSEEDLRVMMDGNPVVFRFDPEFQKLKVVFEGPEAGEHLFRVAPVDGCRPGFKDLEVRITVNAGD